MQFISKLYLILFKWVTKNRKFDRQEQEYKVHLMIGAILLTSVLMWSYTLNSIFCFDDKLLAIIATTTSVLHLLSVFIYRYTANIKLTTHFFTFSGLIFQYTHAFHTGGFYSPTVIWFSLLPLITGLVLEKKELYIWTIISITAVASFYFFQPYTSNSVNDIGRLWMQLNITLGYILVTLFLVSLFISSQEKSKFQLASRNDSIIKLLRIVSHDIANPLMVVSWHNKLLSEKVDKLIDNEKLLKHCASIEKSSNIIQNILNNTRSMKLIDVGQGSKQDILLSLVSLNEIIENSLFIFNKKIEEKKITINYDFEQNKDLLIRVDEVSIKNQVFNNLFSNAIKFMNEKGSISITAVKGAQYITITFSDDGVGMDEEFSKNIFCSKIKTTSTGTSGETGTGFGMPLLSSTLGEIGASISVKSAINKGTSFTIKLMA